MGRAKMLSEVAYRFLVLKFIYSEKVTQFCEIPTLIFSYVVPVKSKVEILKFFVSFSEYMNFTITSRGVVTLLEPTKLSI